MGNQLTSYETHAGNDLELLYEGDMSAQVGRKLCFLAKIFDQDYKSERELNIVIS